ncbi:radical SAM/Cys-rich domain-containing protein [Coccidioides immitis RS]|uniref:Radical SAM/Cys-rich domain-containing protein n=3 Tax=Coccidioides immitis TaxID=5501 RepID=J3K2U4_COCIM|nr:radical SAM/Cys-rich domain-containing protein [Coccidioides immitis RS]EAS28444.3 radical SAM/Cys-rich domain-containing protein [Coccidioides immitis RS]KMP02760.1 radical SAM [Coccidioides immitis RMSCC 2394]KMU92401.1 radical SAM [Coccidioides immitis H538.4]TPX23237.1 hypothetical protein DIZ76_012563 [Coccidioides immitis]
MTLGNWLRLSPVRIRAEVCPATSCSRPSLRTASTGLPPRRRLRFEPAKIPTFADWLSKEEKEIQDANRKRRDKDLRWASDRIPKFHTVMESHQQWPLLRDTPSVLQINVGKLCNLHCRHCHVEAGPTKTKENMSLATIERCLEVLAMSPCITTVDITGGAPELNPYFQTLVREARKMGKTVIDRCNLVVLWERGQEGLVNFLAEQKVNIVASLPCYTERPTDRQRGKLVYNDSIFALKALNERGFGRPSPPTGSSQDGLRLDLVYNPADHSLPPSQSNLEAEYRERLWEDHQITFTSLYTLANMPIRRFADTLLRTGNYEPYMELLANAFNPQTVDGLMCRHTVNVGWDGKLYDCDFNGALEMGTRIGGRSHLDIWDIDNLEDLRDKTIRTGLHCFGCTAGAGSSCGGSLV